MDRVDFEKLIALRQSCRNFSARPIEKELLYSIIEQARNAPSACNSQPWRVYLTCSAEENEKMRKCLQDGGKNGFLDNAQAFCAVYKSDAVTLNAGTEVKFNSSHFAEYDMGEFIAYATLYAKAQGVDSCIIGWVNNQALNTAFGLKGTCDIVIAFGYGADDTVRKKIRKSLSEIVLNEKL